MQRNRSAEGRVWGFVHTRLPVHLSKRHDYPTKTTQIDAMYVVYAHVQKYAQPVNHILYSSREVLPLCLKQGTYRIGSYELYKNMRELENSDKRPHKLCGACWSSVTKEVRRHGSIVA